MTVKSYLPHNLCEAILKAIDNKFDKTPTPQGKEKAPATPATKRYYDSDKKVYTLADDFKEVLGEDKYPNVRTLYNGLITPLKKSKKEGGKESDAIIEVNNIHLALSYLSFNDDDVYVCISNFINYTDTLDIRSKAIYKNFIERQIDPQKPLLLNFEDFVVYFFDAYKEKVNIAHLQIDFEEKKGKLSFPTSINDDNKNTDIGEWDVTLTNNTTNSFILFDNKKKQISQGLIVIQYANLKNGTDKQRFFMGVFATMRNNDNHAIAGKCIIQKCEKGDIEEKMNNLKSNKKGEHFFKVVQSEISWLLKNQTIDIDKPIYNLNGNDKRTSFEKLLILSKNEYFLYFRKENDFIEKNILHINFDGTTSLFNSAGHYKGYVEFSQDGKHLLIQMQKDNIRNLFIVLFVGDTINSTMPEIMLGIASDTLDDSIIAHVVYVERITNGGQTNESNHPKPEDINTKDSKNLRDVFLKEKGLNMLKTKHWITHNKFQEWKKNKIYLNNIIDSEKNAWLKDFVGIYEVYTPFYSSKFTIKVNTLVINNSGEIINSSNELGGQIISYNPDRQLLIIRVGNKDSFENFYYHILKIKSPKRTIYKKDNIIYGVYSGIRKDNTNGQERIPYKRLRANKCVWIKISDGIDLEDKQIKYYRITTQKKANQKKHEKSIRDFGKEDQIFIKEILTYFSNVFNDDVTTNIYKLSPEYKKLVFESAYYYNNIKKDIDMAVTKFNELLSLGEFSVDEVLNDKKTGQTFSDWFVKNFYENTDFEQIRAKYKINKSFEHIELG